MNLTVRFVVLCRHTPGSDIVLTVKTAMTYSEYADAHDLSRHSLYNGINNNNNNNNNSVALIIIMTEPDELYTLRAQYWLGHYQMAVDEAKSIARRPMSPEYYSRRNGHGKSSCIEPTLRLGSTTG